MSKQTKEDYIQFLEDLGDTLEDIKETTTDLTIKKDLSKEIQNIYFEIRQLHDEDYMHLDEDDDDRELDVGTPEEDLDVTEMFK